MSVLAGFISFVEGKKLHHGLLALEKKLGLAFNI